MMFWIWIPVLVVCILLLLRLGSNGRTGGSESPLDILKRRYASGELTTEEYEQQKKILEG